MLRDSLSPDGNFESDAEVSPDTQRADVWFTPDPARPPTRADLGLLGRMTLGACTLAPFHATPGENEVSGCVRKLLTLRLRLMGAGACLRGALVELAALPSETREHAIAATVHASRAG